MHAYSALVEHYRLALGEHPISIFFCNQTETTYRTFSFLGGILEARSEMLREHLRGEEHSPKLVFGPYRAEILRRQLITQGSRQDIFQWPGIQYLAYSDAADLAQVTAAFERAVVGAREPIPEMLLRQHHGDLIRLLSEIRHLLENLRDATAHSRAYFSSAAVAGHSLSPRHFRPRETISVEHQKMFERLDAFDALALTRVPFGVAPLKFALSQMRVEVDALNALRMTMCSTGQTEIPPSTAVQRMRDHLDALVTAFEQCIVEARNLELALAQPGVPQ